MTAKTKAKLAGVAAVGILLLLWYLGPLQFSLLALGVLALALAARFAWWAFLPRHELPRHRVRHLKMRLFCRLHPGRGHATLFELWREWSSRASAKKDRYARP